MKKNILAVAYGGAHARTLAPIIALLQKNPNVHVSVVALTTGKAVFEEYGIETKGFKDYLEADNPEDKIAIEWGRKLSTNTEPHPEISAEETIAYLGSSYKQLVDELGEEQSEKIYQEQGRQVFIPTVMLARIFKQEKPDLLLVTDVPRAERAAIEVACEQQTPVLCIPIEPLKDWNYPWLGSPRENISICVFNKAMADTYLAAGWDTKNIILTGSPMYDKANDERIQQLAYKLRLENNWDKKPALIWLSHEPHGLPTDFSRKLDQILANWCKKNNYSLIVRLHPSENKNLYLPIDGVYFSRAEEPLEIILNAIDVALSFDSTTLIMSSLLNKCVVLLDNNLMPGYANNIKPLFYQPDYRVMSWDELEKILKEAFSRFSNFSNRKNNTPLESASNKINQLILNCLNLSIEQEDEVEQ